VQIAADSVILRATLVDESAMLRLAPEARSSTLILGIAVDGADAHHAYRMQAVDVKFPSQPAALMG